MTGAFRVKERFGREGQVSAIVPVLLAVVGGLILVSLGLLNLIGFGWVAPRQGAVRAETTRVAQKILSILEDDLEHIRGEVSGDPSSGRKADFWHALSRSSGSPPFEFSFTRTGVSRILHPDFPSDEGTASVSSTIIYGVEKGTTVGNPFLKLVRIERFEAGHPLWGKSSKGVDYQVLSEKVNFFDVRPYVISAGGTRRHSYWITLQLVESQNRRDHSHVPTGIAHLTPQGGIYIADYFRNVCPGSFN